MTLWLCSLYASVVGILLLFVIRREYRLARAGRAPETVTLLSVPNVQRKAEAPKPMTAPRNAATKPHAPVQRINNALSRWTRTAPAPHTQSHSYIPKDVTPRLNPEPKPDSQLASQATPAAQAVEAEVAAPPISEKPETQVQRSIAVPAAEPVIIRTYTINEKVVETQEPAKEQEQPVDDEEMARRARSGSKPSASDFYEILQISRNAEVETIHRIYRIMAARFHPDNPQTGDVEKFVALRQAYQTLSDPVRRARYDVAHPAHETPPLPIFELRDFVEGIDAEKNRRLGVLSLLYRRRMMNLDSPGMSMLELEKRMSFPREYLNFTLWYLRTKGFVELMEDNSDYGLSAQGVDFVEAHSSNNHVIRELLTQGSAASNDPVRYNDMLAPTRQASVAPEPKNQSTQNHGPYQSRRHGRKRR